jgi:integrase
MEPDQRLRLPRLRWKHGAYHYDHGGKPRRWQRLGSDEAAARAAYDRIEAARATPPGTVDAMLRDYLEAPRNAATGQPLARGTLANYRSYRGHLAAVFGPLAPESLTQADVVKYLRLAKRKTVRGEIGLLSLAFVAWMDAGRLEFNPCFGVRVRLPASKRVRLLAFDEIDAIVAAADDRLAIAIELAYATGLRISDLCALRWADLGTAMQTQKTGARLRIEATDDVAPLLERARALQARVASPFVLCDRRGQRWKPDTLRSRWNRACAAAGVTDAHFHDLRAAAGTEVERLFGLRAARDFLGHTTEQTTQGYVRGRRANVVRPLVRRKA